MPQTVEFNQGALEIKPHVISITDDVASKKKNIVQFVQDAVTLTMAQIANDL